MLFLYQSISQLCFSDDRECCILRYCICRKNTLCNNFRKFDCHIQYSLTKHCDVCCAVDFQLKDLKAEMQELERYDTMHVVKSRQANQRLKTDLDQCRKGNNPITKPTQPYPHGKS